MSCWEDGTPKSHSNAFTAHLQKDAADLDEKPRKKRKRKTKKRVNPLDLKPQSYFAIVPTDMHKTTRIMRASI